MTNGMQNAVQKPEKVKKRFWRFAAVLAVIFALGGTVFYFGLLDPRTWELIRQDWAARQLWKQIQQEQRREAEDPYGGQTPQETYQLFVDALKKEDIDLAVKYFVFEDQEQVKKWLTTVRSDENKWTRLIRAFTEENANIEWRQWTDRWSDVTVYEDQSKTAVIGIFYIKRTGDYPVWKLVIAP